MVIIGAGMSGLLAGQYFRSHNPLIVEKQGTLPNNHKALLRFRSEAVADLSGIQFKKVRVHKMINNCGSHHKESTLYMNNMYSYKVIGDIRSRSALNLADSDRYIAPDDFIDRLSNGLDIAYNVNAEAIVRAQRIKPEEPLISTMPISTLAKNLNYDLDCELNTRSIWTVKTRILEPVCDVYQTVYYTSHLNPLYRVSITGNEVITEFCEDPSRQAEWGKDLASMIDSLLNSDFGIRNAKLGNIECGFQKYGKLIPVDGSQVKDFIGWATRSYNIYSLGRWGTHRQILMDDVVADLKVIRNMILSNQYNR